MSSCIRLERAHDRELGEAGWAAGFCGQKGMVFRRVRRSGDVGWTRFDREKDPKRYQKVVLLVIGIMRQRGLAAGAVGSSGS